MAKNEGADRPEGASGNRGGLSQDGGTADVPADFLYHLTQLRGLLTERRPQQLRLHHLRCRLNTANKRIKKRKQKMFITNGVELNPVPQEPGGQNRAGRPA